MFVTSLIANLGWGGETIQSIKMRAILRLLYFVDKSKFPLFNQESCLAFLPPACFAKQG